MTRAALVVLVAAATVFLWVTPDRAPAPDARDEPLSVGGTWRETVDPTEALPALAPQVTGAFIGGGEPILVRTSGVSAGLACCLPGPGSVLFDSGDIVWWGYHPDPVHGCGAEPPAVRAAIAAFAGNACITGHGNIDGRVAGAIAALITEPPSTDPQACADCGHETIRSFPGNWTFRESSLGAMFDWTSDGDSWPAICDRETGDLALCQAVLVTRAVSGVSPT